MNQLSYNFQIVYDDKTAIVMSTTHEDDLFEAFFLLLSFLVNAIEPLLFSTTMTTVPGLFHGSMIGKQSNTLSGNVMQ